MRTLALVLLAACGGGSGTPDGHITVNDGGANCVGSTATPNYGTVAPAAADSIGYYDMATAPAFLEYGGKLNADATPDVIQIELYKGAGTWSSGELGPKNSILLEGVETQYATCGACVRLFTDLSDAGVEVDQYLATSGTLNITQTSPMIAGTLVNATFTHVTIAAAPDFTSTPVGDCDGIAIDSLAFTATTVQSPD